MALTDLAQFLVERLQAFDPTIDTSSGSPADEKVIQPVLRRLGSDPYSVDLGLFAQERLNQAFPELATHEGDAITDLLIKGGTLLWSPIVREVVRVKQNASLADPSVLVRDEAVALLANVFAKPPDGARARGQARLYFAQPQNVTVSPANFLTSRGDLHFFPVEVQSISVQEMLLNVEDGLYYVDINVVAEKTGSDYNLEPNDLVTIANLASPVRVTNRARFRLGLDEADTETLVARVDQNLSERSLVTQRGAAAKITEEVADVTQLAVVGMGDGAMRRDVLSGGGYGPVLAGGRQGRTAADGEGRRWTRRLVVDDPEVDFVRLVGPPMATPKGFFVTLHDAFAPEQLPRVRDLGVRRVLDAKTLELDEQVLVYAADDVPWTLRQRTLTLSGIPGGILFPNSVDGTLAVPADEIHLGGASDYYVRGQDTEPATLVLSSIIDDRPLLQGLRGHTDVTLPQAFVLGDLVLAPGAGANYAAGDRTYDALAALKTQGGSIQVLDVPNAGSYRVLDVVQTPGSAPLLFLAAPLTHVDLLDFRWRVSDVLDIDLLEPKETRVAGPDLVTVQGDTRVSTRGGTDFDAVGVAPGDVVRITTAGLLAGDYVVQQVLSPFFTYLELDRPLPATVTGVSYVVFRPNPDGGLETPFVRIDSIDLLDTAGQPVGTTVPYARPVDARSGGFANAARGVKADVTDATLGIVTRKLGTGAYLPDLTLAIQWDTDRGRTDVNVTFTSTDPGEEAGDYLPAQDVADQLNLASASSTEGQVTRLAVVLDGDRVGILPVGRNVRVVAGTARTTLFGVDDVFTARDIRTASLAPRGWEGLSPTLDALFDVAQVLDGLQIGFYGDLQLPGTASDPLRTSADFSPEINRHVQVGARSLGTARVYFLDPTSFEVDARRATFTLTTPGGGSLVFFPDPTNNYQRIPALPAGTKPSDGQTGNPTYSSRTFYAPSTDFLAKGIQVGDLLTIDYVPLVGDAPLPDPIPALHGKTLVLSLRGGPGKTIVFSHDNTAIPAGAVTRQGVIDQINKAAGQVICELDGGNRLRFAPDLLVQVRQGGSANVVFGLSTTGDQNNRSPNYGQYVIAAVSTNWVQIDGFFPSNALVTGQQFSVARAGVQRIVSTDMAKNVGTAGLYYVDIQLVSQGTGDQYNIAPDQRLVVEGYRSDGYFLTTEDPNLSFSPLERPVLHVSTSLLEVGTSDDPQNAIPLSGQNLQVNYQRSVVTENVNNFVLSETERVINQSPLARHLIPYYVRFDVQYAGGSKETVVKNDLTTFVLGLRPSDALEVSDVVQRVMGRGATAVDNPIDLIAVVHQVDRTVVVERSQDKLNTGRLAAFLPDVLRVTRRVA